MAIKISGSTIIDDSRNIVNAGVVTATSFSGSGASLTNVDATTLDGVDSTSFLRSDAADIKTSGNLTFNDNIVAQFGTGSDLKIYHDSAQSLISQEGAGDLTIRNLNDDNDVIIQSDDGSGGATNYFRADGSTGESILYHYGTQKLATKSTGVTVTGSLCATTLYGDGSNLTNINAGFSPDAQQNLYAGTGAGAASDADTCFNIALGCNAGAALNAGDYNIFLGCNSGSTATTAGGTAAIGRDAGKNLTGGNRNVFLGQYAGKGNSSFTSTDNIFIGCGSGGLISTAVGSHNIGLGEATLHLLQSTACGNVAVGREAGQKATSGDYNFFGGYGAGKCITTGCCNIFIGRHSGCGTNAKTGSSNIVLGSCSGASLSTGNHNVFLGTEAGKNITEANCGIYIGGAAGSCRGSGDHNVAIGQVALLGGSVVASNTGFNNVAIGCAAGNATTSGAANVFIGEKAGTDNTTGNSNVFLGMCAGCTSTTSGCSIFIGRGAGFTSNASFNIFLGKYAGYDNTSGCQNIMMGCCAGANATTGCCNIFLGVRAASSAAVTGNNNIGLGYRAGNKLTSGYENVMLGKDSSLENTTGYRNVTIGLGAAQCMQTGCDNVAIGYEALMGSSTVADNTGDENIAIGYYAGRCLSSGCYNNFIGFRAGQAITTGCCNTLIGNYAGGALTTTSWNIMIGDCAGRCSTTTGANNIYLGRGAGRCTSSTGSNNTFLGYYAGRCNTSGYENIFIGKYTAACGPITGYQNIAIGSNAGKKLTSGDGNIFLGDEAGACNTTGNHNFIAMTNAGLTGTCSCDNVIIGINAGYANNGNANIFLGRCAGRDNSTGCYNLYLGCKTGQEATTGCYNIFFGHEAVSGGIVTGNDNISVGRNSGCCLTSGTNNIFLGRCAGCTNTTGSANIAIGKDIVLPSATASAQLAIGCGTNRWITGDSNFNVGIGTDNPTGKLQIGSATGSHVIITENTGVDINDGAINLYQATSNVNATPFIISTDVGGTETEKLRVTAAGNVGINSTSPSHSLEVAYTNDDDGFVVNHANRGGKWRFATSGSNAELFDVRRYDGANSTFRRYLLFGSDQFSVYTGSTTAAHERFRIGSAGQIGLSGANYGTDGQVLTSRGSAHSPIWQTVSAGGSPEFYTGITSSTQITPLSFETSVFTFPSTSGRQYVIESINVANVDESVGVGTTVNIIASIQDATAAEQTYIAYNVPIVTGGLIELLKNPIVAGPSDVIKMWTTNDDYVGVNNAADVYINYTEFESTDYISKFASSTTINSTDAVTLYTSTGNPTMIEKIGFANRTDTGDFPVSIKITNGVTTSYLAKNLIIPRYSTVDILDRHKRIETGAKIEVEVGSTGTIDVIISGKKITS